jgi:hypothetical protein
MKENPMLEESEEERVCRSRRNRDGKERGRTHTESEDSEVKGEGEGASDSTGRTIWRIIITAPILNSLLRERRKTLF